MHVHHKHVDIAVVVEVAECRAAAGMLLQDAGAGQRGDVLEAGVAEIAVDQTLALVGLDCVDLGDLWVDVAGDLEEVLPANRLGNVG